MKKRTEETTTTVQVWEHGNWVACAVDGVDARGEPYYSTELRVHQDNHSGGTSYLPFDADALTQLAELFTHLAVEAKERAAANAGRVQAMEKPVVRNA